MSFAARLDEALSVINEHAMLAAALADMSDSTATLVAADALDEIGQEHRAELAALTREVLSFRDGTPKRRHRDLTDQLHALMRDLEREFANAGHSIFNLEHQIIVTIAQDHESRQQVEFELVPGGIEARRTRLQLAANPNDDHNRKVLATTRDFYEGLNFVPERLHDAVCTTLFLMAIYDVSEANWLYSFGQIEGDSHFVKPVIASIRRLGRQMNNVAIDMNSGRDVREQVAAIVRNFQAVVDYARRGQPEDAEIIRTRLEELLESERSPHSPNRLPTAMEAINALEDAIAALGGHQ